MLFIRIWYKIQIFIFSNNFSQRIFAIIMEKFCNFIRIIWSSSYNRTILSCIRYVSTNVELVFTYAQWIFLDILNQYLKRFDLPLLFYSRKLKLFLNVPLIFGTVYIVCPRLGVTILVILCFKQNNHSL